MFQSKNDENLGYARSLLDALFGQVNDTAVPTLKAAAFGPQIKADNHKGHLTLFTMLLEAQLLAEALGRSANLERKDLLMDIIHKRLGHMAHRLIEKDLKARKKDRPFGFQQVIDAVSEWTSVLQRWRPASTPLNFPDGEAIDETQQTETHSMDRCGVCDGNHSTERCTVLVHLHPNDKVRRIKEKRLCLHCFCPHHLARDCSEIPFCLVCHQPHHTILYG